MQKTLDDKMNLETFRTDIDFYVSKPRKNGVPSTLVAQTIQGEIRRYSFTFSSKLKYKTINSHITVAQEMEQYAKDRIRSKTGYSGPLSILGTVKHGSVTWIVKTNPFRCIPVPLDESLNELTPPPAYAEAVPSNSASTSSSPTVTSTTSASVNSVPQPAPTLQKF